MDELKEYVNSLFKYQPISAETADLKDEIYSNMVAKKQDLIEQGYLDKEALKITKASLTSVEGILGDYKIVYINRLKLEEKQTLLLASVIMWILSIPTMIVISPIFSFISLFLVVLCGVLYYTERRKDQSEVALISIMKSKKVSRIVWIGWIAFFFITTLTVSAILFSSNLWFSQPVTIKGPFALASLIAKYYVPLITIVFPVAVGTFPKIFIRYERTDHDE